MQSTDIKLLNGIKAIGTVAGLKAIFERVRECYHNAVKLKASRSNLTNIT